MTVQTYTEHDAFDPRRIISFLRTTSDELARSRLTVIDDANRLGLRV